MIGKKGLARFGGWVLLCAVICVFPHISEAREATPIKPIILNIASYHPGYGWSDDCLKGIDQQLQGQYVIHHFFLDAKRRAAPELAVALENAWKKVQQVNPSMVMLGDDFALKHLGARLAKQALPVVFYGINGNPRSYFDGRIPANVSGVLERVLLVPLVRGVIDLVGESPKQQIAVLSDASVSSAAQLETQFNSDRHKKIGPFDVVYLDLPHWQDWRTYIKNAHKTNAALVLINYHAIKDQGRPMDYMDVLGWISHNAQVPFFIVQKDVGPGLATGALLIDGVNHGALAASVAQNLLQGAKIGPVMEDQEGKYVFSRSQFKRFQLPIPQALSNRQIVE